MSPHYLRVSAQGSGTKADRSASRRPLVLAGLLVVCLLFTSGCATSSIHEIKVTATLLGPGAQAGSFRLVPKPLTAIEQDHIEQAKTLVRRALVRRGYREASGDQAPDLFIYVGCGLSTGPVRQQTYDEPFYITRPGRVRYEQQQVGTSANGTPIYQMVAVQDPPEQVIGGYRTMIMQSATFKKYLRLVAFTENPGDGERQTPALWGIHATYESDDRAISRVLPMLTAAGMIMIGSHTKGPTSIRMKATDPDVVALRAER